MEQTARTKWKKALYALAACVLAAAFFFAGFGVRSLTLSKELRTMRWVLGQIEKYYYEDFTADELVGAMTEGIDQLLLDKYSSYYTAEEYALVQAQARGSKSGTGLTFRSRDTLQVYKVSGNSPAERAGIRAGDVVTALDEGEGFVAVRDYADFSARLSAIPADTDFGIRAERGGESMDFVLGKREYVENCVYYADRAGSARYLSDSGEDPVLSRTYEQNSVFPADVAYIRLTSFTGKAYEQFAGVMDLFRSGGRRALVLDLRSNGGGNMAIFEKIASHLVGGAQKNFPVAVARYKDGSEAVFRAPEARYAEYSFRAGGIALLADSGSASASEALIGAMLDYGSLSLDNLIITAEEGEEGVRALTFGKGIMQTTFQRRSGEAIKLTTARIYWPLTDTCIHGTGIGTTEENRVPANPDNLPYTYEGDAELARALARVSA